MSFKVNKDLIVRAYVSTGVTRANGLPVKAVREFNYDDLSKYVSYFLKKINDIPHDFSKKIGISHGLISIQSVAFMLALIKSGKNYVVFFNNTDNFPEYFEAIKDSTTHLFMVGGFDKEYHIEDHAGLYSYTDSFETIVGLDAHEGRENLEFKFSKRQRIYNKFHLDGPIELTCTTGLIEQEAVKTAISSYFVEDDYCVIYRPFKHIGVATLHTYPAFFTVKGISICDDIGEWEQEYHRATHIHISYNMIQLKWPLPKKLRMLTSGGYPFNSDCLEYVTSQSDIDNIIDCYGTRYCVPPMAIRLIPKNNVGLLPFKWVNNFVRPENIENRLYFRAPKNTFSNIAGANSDGTLLNTGDIIENTSTENEFYFYGQHVKFIRVDHVRVNYDDFVSFVKAKTTLTDFKVEFRNLNGMDAPVLLVSQSDYSEAKQFIDSYSIELTLSVQ